MKIKKNMVTKIGKILFLIKIILNLNLIYSGSIELKLLSANRRIINDVSLGVPFIIEVILKDIENQEPKIDGLDQFIILNKFVSQNVTIINGNKSTQFKYVYNLKTEQLGKKSIGPARILKPNLISNKIEFEVTDKPISSNQDVELTLNVEENEIYLGQKVDFKIQFSYALDNLSIKEIQRPDSENIKIININQPELKSIVKNGKTFNFIDVKGTFFPKKAGKIIISPIKATYTLEDKDDEFSSFFGFINTRRRTDEIYSNSLSLNIKDLPKTDLDINAIGEFRKFAAKLDKNKAQEGDGVLLVLSVEGDGNFDEMKMPKLNLPKEIKYYESKSTIEGTEPNLIKKFEYILQGINPGNWQIEPQKFVFFDLKSKSYKVLKTDSLSLTIEKSNKITKENIKEEQEKPEKLLDYSFDKVVPDLDKDIEELGKRSGYYFIDWFIFVILILLPILFILFKKLYMRFFENLINKHKEKRVFVDLKNRLIKLEKTNNIKEAYQEFNSIFSKLTQNQDLNTFLKELGLDDKMIFDWNNFYNNILSFSDFSPIKEDKNINKKEIFVQAIKWADIFNQKFLNLNNIKINIFIIIFLLNFNLFSQEVNQQEIKEVDNSLKNIQEKVVSLRKIQKRSIGQDYIKVENLINKIKEENNIKAESRFSNLFNFIYSIVSLISLLIWQLIFLVLLYSLIFFYNKLKKVYFLTIIFFTIICCFSLSVFYYYNHYKWAVIKEKKTILYLGPDFSYPVKGDLNYLSDVVILKEYNNWFYVKSNLNSGWISSKNVESI